MNEKRKIIEAYYSAGKRHHPVNATIEVTGLCNASCNYCFMAPYSNHAGPTLEQLRTILDKLSESGVLYLGITGGEPFLRSDILDILSYAIKKDFFRITLLTNGTLISDTHMDFLKKRKPYFAAVQFSVFSDEEEENDRYLGVKGALQAVVKRGEQLLESGILAQVALNVFPAIIDRLPKVIDFFKSKGFFVRIAHSKLQVKDSARFCAEDCAPSETFFKQYFANFPNRLKPTIASQNKTNKSQNGLCIGRIMGITIGFNGDVLVCPPARKMPLGNLITDNGSLTEILAKSEAYAQIRKMTKDDIPQCKSCKYKEHCAVCIGQMLMEHGDLTKPPTHMCVLAKAQESLRNA